MNDCINHIKAYMQTRGLHRLDIRAALIDMDGVLYNSMPRHTVAWKRLCDELGIEATRDEFYLYEGMTGAATIQHIYQRQYGRKLSDGRLRELYARKARYFSEQGPAEPMPGADRMLATLRDAGIERVLVTGSAQHSILTSLNRDYPDAFADDKRVTALDVTHGKPDPEPYIMGQRKAGVSPEQAIVIENAPLGCQAGAASGSLVIAVATGPIPEATLRGSGAHLVLPSMPAFADALPTILSTLHEISN